RTHCDDLAALLDRCPAPVWVANPGGSGYANQACLAWLGARAESAGFDLYKYLHPEDRAAWLQAREGRANDSAPLDAEIRLRRSDGEYRHVRVAAVTVPAPGETGTRLVGFLQDVTSGREAAQAL